MSLLQRVCKTLGILGLAVAMPSLVLAQSGSGYITNGVEYAPAGSLPGDQIYPSLALTTSGGYLVWADNVTDGSGYGISAARLDSSFSPTLGNFRINLNGADDQERPQVSLLKNGGAAIVWQGGKQSFQHIYAAFLSSSNTFVAQDVHVNTATNWQRNPVVATLTNGNVVVAWSSQGQDNADRLQGVYAQLFTPAGVKTNGEFPVNLWTAGNQRSPAVAALSNGKFVVTWVSEKQGSSQVVTNTTGGAGPGYNSVQIYARLFDTNGAAASGEILVNTSTNVCANPSVAAASDGTFVIAWGQKDPVVVNNSWDVFARRFSSTGSGGTVQRVNTQRYGDQFAPKISAAGTDYLVVWTSMGQDGSREGVFGQYLHGDGTVVGSEFRVNTTVLNQQMYPAVASDGVGRFLVAWSSYVGGVESLDLNAQRYATYQQPLSPPGAPIVSALDSYTLSVTWSPLAGFTVDHWELYVDGASTPIILTSTFWQNEGLYNSLVNDYSFNPGTTHTFQLAYVLTDGRHSPLSDIASGKTWGQDRFGSGGTPDGLPDDWQTLYWGTNKVNWPSLNTRVAPNGPTVYQVFQWGANPFDPSTWLKTTIDHNYQGWFLAWNTQPGSIYQVQTSADLKTWTNLGVARFAAGTTDSLYLGLANKGYYRITRLVY